MVWEFILGLLLGIAIGLYLGNKKVRDWVAKLGEKSKSGKSEGG